MDEHQETNVLMEIDELMDTSVWTDGLSLEPESEQEADTVGSQPLIGPDPVLQVGGLGSTRILIAIRPADMFIQTETASLVQGLNHMTIQDRNQGGLKQMMARFKKIRMKKPESGHSRVNNGRIERKSSAKKKVVRKGKNGRIMTEEQRLAANSKVQGCHQKYKDYGKTMDKLVELTGDLLDISHVAESEFFVNREDFQLQPLPEEFQLCNFGPRRKKKSPKSKDEQEREERRQANQRASSHRCSVRNKIILSNSTLVCLHNMKLIEEKYVPQLGADLEVEEKWTEIQDVNHLLEELNYIPRDVQKEVMDKTKIKAKGWKQLKKIFYQTVGLNANSGSTKLSATRGLKPNLALFIATTPECLTC